MKSLLLKIMVLLLIAQVAATQVFAQVQDRPMSAIACSYKNAKGTYTNEGKACVLDIRLHKVGTCQGGACKE